MRRPIRVHARIGRLASRGTLDRSGGLRRVFAVDVLRCHRRGGRRRLIAQITQASVVVVVLTALGLPTDVPRLHPAMGAAGLDVGTDPWV